jgi:hypothetical protein
MNARRYQSGMSIPGILAVMIMVGFFFLCAIRITPPYVEYLSVKGIIERIVMDPETPKKSIRQIRHNLDMTFNTNQIYELKPRAIKIYNKKGKMYIDANYEVRLPIVWRIDAVLKLNDLHYTVGNPEPIIAEEAKKKVQTLRP